MVKRKVTVLSPKSHLKDRTKQDKTNMKERSFGKRVYDASFGKYSVPFKGRSISKRNYLGGHGLLKIKEPRRNTQFMEFDLSFRKIKTDLVTTAALVSKRTPSFS